MATVCVKVEVQLVARDVNCRRSSAPRFFLLAVCNDMYPSLGFVIRLGSRLRESTSGVRSLSCNARRTNVYIARRTSSRIRRDLSKIRFASKDSKLTTEFLKQIKSVLVV